MANRELREFSSEIGRYTEDIRPAFLRDGEQSAFDEIEEIVAGGLKGYAVALAMALDDVAGIGLAQGVRHQGLLPVVQAVETTETLFGGA